MLVETITINLTEDRAAEITSFPDAMLGSPNACIELCARAYPDWTSMVVVVRRG